MTTAQTLVRLGYAKRVSPISPTLEGFRVAFRRPSLTLGEIMWRWCFGATGIALFFFALFELLNTLTVTNGELLFLRTRHPYFVSQAVAHILRGSLGRAVMSGMVAILLLALLWMIAASFGRMATVRALLGYFRVNFAQRMAATDVSTSLDETDNRRSGNPFRSLFDLSFLRVSVALGAVLAIVGATIVAGFASPASHPQPGWFLLLWFPIIGLICVVWWTLNWFLSLAGLFVVRDAADALSAISAAVSLCRERTAAVFAVSIWTGLAHMAAFVGATTVVAMPLSTLGILPGRVILLGVFVLTLAYFALADWLYMARLAGYVCIAEMPEAWLAPPSATFPPPAPPTVQTTIDRNELILSDVPGLIPQT
jgi:hypothetical protein